MLANKRNERIAEAAAALDAHLPGGRGLQVTQQLATGLGALADAMFTRIHADVERVFGVDSMLMPLSEVKSEQLARREIGAYQAVESAMHAAERKYLPANPDWYAHWLAGLLLAPAHETPDVTQAIEGYLANPSLVERRRQFSNRLETALAEARRVPLVAYHLLPLAIRLATSLAFGDQQMAYDLRRRQMSALSSIESCPACRGQVLEIGDSCADCGNPFWNYQYLTAG